MFTPTISNMKPAQILQKQAFTRILPADNLAALQTNYAKYNTERGYKEGELAYSILTQADFMREFDQDAHKILSPAYYPNPISKDPETGQFYERKLARVTVNLPEIFANQRTALLTGNELDLKLMSGGTSKSMQDRFSRFLEGWAYRNMEVAVYNLIYSNAVTGDGAVIFFTDSGKVGWRSASYMKGDVLYPHYDTYGRLALFGRRYRMAGEDGRYVTYLDVWDEAKYTRYRSETNKKGTVAWVVDEKPKPHGFNRVPVSYVRYGAPFWAGAMNDVDNIEMALSQLVENNKHYALRILYALGADMQVKASFDGRPMQINSIDPNAKVGYLEPADASGSFSLQLNRLFKDAYQAAHCVEAPEIKSGADMSSLTVQMLYADAYHQSLLDAKIFQSGIDDIVSLFQQGWGIETGKPSDFDESVFRVKGKIHPYIMRSENEEVNNIAVLANSGGLPKKAVADEAYKLGYGTPRNYDDLLQEEHDALVGEQQAAASANSVNESRGE